jgi:DNA repair exonuclease SbcCD ATPase subunit
LGDKEKKKKIEKLDLSHVTRELDNLRDEVKKVKTRINNKDAGNNKSTGLDGVKRTPKSMEALGYARPDIAMVTLSEVHDMTKKKVQKKQEVANVPKNIEETDKKIEAMRNLTMKMPELRVSLEAVKDDMEDHHEAVAETKEVEDSLHKQAEDVMTSVSDLKEDMIDKMKRDKVDELETEQLIDKTARDLDSKIEMMSRKLEETLDRLGQRIDNTTKTSKIEMASNMAYLKNQMEQFKSELPKFAKKTELNKAKEEKKHVKRKRKKKSSQEEAKITYEDRQPDVPSIATTAVTETSESVKSEAAPVEEVQETEGEKMDTVSISELDKYKGEEVFVACEIELTKTVEEDDAKIYGYTLRDETGEIMMTGAEEIADQKAKIRCMVNETDDGKVYLRLVSVEKAF